MNKEVIYIDIEDDITAIIGKVKESRAKIVALVPPKRSTVFSSVVNLKLLKKAAETKNKRVVLITTENGLTSLAGGIGMFVAANLESAPAIPRPKIEEAKLPSNIIVAGSEESHEFVPGAKLKSPQAESDEKTKEDDKPQKEQSNEEKKLKPIKKKKDKLKVPSFKRFKKRLILGSLAVIVLVLGWWQAFLVLPKAEITLFGQTQNLASELDVTLDTKAEAADFEKNILPAQTEELKKELSITVSATGEKNLGKKASGTMTIQNCGDDDPVTFSKGTRFVSSSGVVFVSDQAVTVPGADIEDLQCKSAGEESVAVTAEKPGESYNIASDHYSISGYSSNYTGTGTDMGGGTDKIVKVITQDDIDKAAKKLERNDEEAKKELAALFREDVYLFEESIEVNKGKVTSEPKAGQEADVAEVMVAYTYKGYGVNKEQINELLETKLADDISNQQTIVDSGLDEAQIDEKNKSGSERTFSIKTTAVVGPDLDIEALQEELKGKDFSEARTTLNSIPGIVNSEINLSPFYVFSMPRKASNININLEVSQPKS